MHGHVNHAEFLDGIRHFLGGYYLFLAAMNGVAAFYLWKKGRTYRLFQLPVAGAITNAHLWLLVAIVFSLLSPLAMSGDDSFQVLVSMPEGVRNLMDLAMGPINYAVGSVVIFAVMIYFREFFVRPLVAWGMLNLSLLVMGLSMTDHDFSLIVTKPDNVPIVAMVFLLGFFTWLGASKAVENDRRAQQGLEPMEALGKEKILVWPDLVYTELICMILVTAVLLVWAIALKAPLEEPASSVKTPNPSKAPWYFLGLQEMLVYFDPWMAGVVLPSMVIFGLMAIPFLDVNKKGRGYYTIAQRPFAYVTFQFGFLVLWVTLIVMGTFLRGPNWNFFGLYETWDAHKVEALNNIDLSEVFWVALGSSRPKAPENAGALWQLGYIVLREAPGFAVLGFYFGALPPAMVLYSKFFRGLFVRMGFLRYMVMSNLLLTMILLPVKMGCRFVFNLKYFIAIPEYFTNF